MKVTFKEKKMKLAVLINNCYCFFVSVFFYFIFSFFFFTRNSMNKTKFIKEEPRVQKGDEKFPSLLISLPLLHSLPDRLRINLSLYFLSLDTYSFLSFFLSIYISINLSIFQYIYIYIYIYIKKLMTVNIQGKSTQCTAI